MDVAGSESTEGVEVRALRTLDEYAMCVELQQLTWGRDFGELVPRSLLKVTGRIGGVLAGAFDASGGMLGFVFGLTGVEDGTIVHWSHMLAVRPEARDRGIGRRLKQHQSTAVRALGAQRMYWTFDPLVARNAHLNLNRLGVEVREYVPDMYGRTGSDLHSGLGTDRLVVVWHLGAEAAGLRTPEAVTGEDPALSAVDALPVVSAAIDASGGRPSASGRRVPDPPVRIEVPADIQTIKEASPERAALWRAATRRAFLRYLENGSRVVAFHRDAGSGRCFYVLDAPTQTSKADGG